MIIQGTNVPITIEFDQDITNIPVIVATIWSACCKNTDVLKVWNKSDMTVDGDKAVLPLSEQETSTFPESIYLEVKGLDGSGQTIFWDEELISVKHRRDRVIQLVTTI